MRGRAGAAAARRRHCCLAWHERPLGKYVVVRRPDEPAAGRAGRGPSRVGPSTTPRTGKGGPGGYPMSAPCSPP